MKYWFSVFCWILLINFLQSRASRMIRSTLGIYSGFGFDTSSLPLSGRFILSLWGLLSCYLPWDAIASLCVSTSPLLWHSAHSHPIFLSFCIVICHSCTGFNFKKYLKFIIYLKGRETETEIFHLLTHSSNTPSLARPGLGQKQEPRAQSGSSSAVAVAPQGIHWQEAGTGRKARIQTQACQCGM